MKNNQLSFDIPDELYKQQLQHFKFALHGRLLLQKGDSPRFAEDIKRELQETWKISAPWQVILLGKGFFTLRFSGESDMMQAKSKAFWKLKTGIMKIREWTPLFNPYKETSTLAQVWMRIYYLPHELWHPEVVTGISRVVGNPIKMDGTTFQGAVGHFARVLVEMDVTKDILYNLNITRGSASFDIEFVYENLPFYCGICRKIGHSSDKCRRKTEDVLKEDQGNKPEKQKIDTATNDPGGLMKKKPDQNKDWKKVNTRKIDTKNSFAVLDVLAEKEKSKSDGQGSET
ncbi:uncharacterized protein LOC130994201 [Salvia miltiorrhiza]|uniref:uncharacterized protein LOC130994201 n=1 Tax=Salvia miltiorrhiza TaxID=226208 RepID=UPI0025AC3E15|nr:uncharacterized protein LOC130994201 [Salvia miltiorrhiza]